MLQIKNPNINNIARWWSSELEKFLFDSITDKRKKPYYITATKHRKYFNTYFEKYEYLYFIKCRKGIYKKIPVTDRNKLWLKIKNFLKDEKNRIGEKDTLIHNIADQTGDTVLKSLKKVVEDIFIEIYTDFTKSHAHDLLESLNIRCCPYCNRSYTFAVEKGGKDEVTTRPEFDHFYNKSEFPMLAVSFFNLIPSCPICNHGKGIRSASINPYFDSFKSKFILTKKYDEVNVGTMVTELNVNEVKKLSQESEFSVAFECQITGKDNPEEKRNIQTFGLIPLYNRHKDYVMEIVEKANAYDVITRSDIVDRFQGLFHNEEEVFNLIFGKYLQDAELQKRPLSKLTADILDQLDIRPHLPIP